MLVETCVYLIASLVSAVLSYCCFKLGACLRIGDTPEYIDDESEGMEDEVEMQEMMEREREEEEAKEREEMERMEAPGGSLNGIPAIPENGNANGTGAEEEDI